MLFIEFRLDGRWRQNPKPLKNSGDAEWVVR